MNPRDPQLQDKSSLCGSCGGTGLVIAHSHEDYGVSFESEHCTDCDYGQALIRIDELEDELYEAREALKAIDRLSLEWQAPLTHDVCENRGAAAWAAVGSGADLIAHRALGGSLESARARLVS